MFVGYAEECVKLSQTHVQSFEELKCMHEEADTLLIFHAAHASQEGYQNVVLVSEDTDVMIIALPLAKQINMLQKRGNQNLTRLVNLTKIAEVLLVHECEALVGLYAFTGCDTISSFAGKGKLLALRLMRKNEKYIRCFAEFGRNLHVSDDMFLQLEEFVCGR